MAALVEAPAAREACDSGWGGRGPRAPDQPAALGVAHARDLVALRGFLGGCRGSRRSWPRSTPPLLATLGEEITPLPDLQRLLEEALEDEPPLPLREGGLIREAWNEELRRAQARARARARHGSPPSSSGSGAHRHPVAQGPLQPRVRLRHRGQQRRTRPGCRPTTCAARPSSARSATSPPSSRSTRAGSSAPRSASPGSSSSSSGRCAAQVAAQARAAPAHRAGGGHARRAGLARRGGPRAGLRAARGRRRARARDRGRTAPGAGGRSARPSPPTTRALDPGRRARS